MLIAMYHSITSASVFYLSNRKNSRDYLFRVTTYVYFS